MNPTQLFPSIIRTVVPLLVALITSLLVKAGIDPGPYQELISQLVGAAVATAYYVAVRLFEARVRPWLGWLLGLPKQPTYDAPARPADDSPTGYEATATSPAPEDVPVEVVPDDQAFGSKVDATGYVPRHAEPAQEPERDPGL